MNVARMMKIAVVPGVVAAGIACSPLAHADDGSLTDAVRQVYTQVQTKCTPNMPPNFQGIQLTGNGEGRIIDANPSLGGQFQYMSAKGAVGVPSASYYRVGDWFINLEFC